MKKILLLLMFAPLLMGMKVVYKNETGEIKAIGPFVNYKASDGESVIDVEIANPSHIKTHIVEDGIYRAKSDAELKAVSDAEKQAKNVRKAKKQAVKAKLTELGISAEDLISYIKDGE